VGRGDVAGAMNRVGDGDCGKAETQITKKKKLIKKKDKEIV
jgi:hypothetical protein